MARAIRVLLASLALQFRLMRLEGIVFTIVVPPVLYAVVLVLVMQHAGRSDLAAYAVIGPAVLGSWGTAIGISGHVVTEDRWTGTLELILTAPGGGWLVILGRVMGTAVFSLVAVAESLVVGQALGMPVTVRDVPLFVVAVAACVASVGAFGLILAALYMFVRSARLFTNVLAFPLIILSGAAFPIELLPAAGQALSDVVSLKWGAQLLRAAVGAGEASVASGIVMISLLTGAYLAIGRVLFAFIERRVRVTGTLSSYD